MHDLTNMVQAGFLPEAGGQFRERWSTSQCQSNRSYRLRHDLDSAVGHQFCNLMLGEHSAFTFPSKPVVLECLLIICLHVMDLCGAHQPTFTQNQTHSCWKTDPLSETSLIIVQQWSIFSCRLGGEGAPWQCLNQQGRLCVCREHDVR